MVDELRAMPQVKQTVDIHRVAYRSKLSVYFSCMQLSRMPEQCALLPEARFASVVWLQESRISVRTFFCMICLFRLPSNFLYGRSWVNLLGGGGGRARHFGRG